MLKYVFVENICYFVDSDWQIARNRKYIFEVGIFVFILDDFIPISLTQDI